MTDLFDRALHYLGNYSDGDIFVINIGAMDGILFDEMHGYSAMYHFKGLYVEPIPYLFEKLQKNLGQENLFEQCAIADYDGEIEMLMIDRAAIDNGLVHKCFYGMSAVYPPRNGLGSQADKETVDKYGTLIKVPCMTFEKVLRKHNVFNFDIIKIDAEGYDCKIFQQINLTKYMPKVVRLEWINLSDVERDSILKILDKSGYIYEISQDLVAISKEFYSKMELSNLPSKQTPIVTLVTGLWNIGRSGLEENWARTYQNYLSQFEKLLDVDHNLIIFGDDSLEKFVWQKRNKHNTLFVRRDLSWFKSNNYYHLIQKIRTNSDWSQQVDWLKNSPQAKLEMYNPIVMSKMFLLNDARILDQFNSDYLFWIDAGLSFTVHPGYFTHDKVLHKLPKYASRFMFFAFPYTANTEIHGFKFDQICQKANRHIDKVARGGFFGGPVQTIAQINSIYYGLLMDTLGSGLMGTEESIFSIIMYKHADIVNYVEIMSDGLLWRFFEDLKNDNVIVKNLRLVKH